MSVTKWSGDKLLLSQAVTASHLSQRDAVLHLLQSEAVLHLSLHQSLRQTGHLTVSFALLLITSALLLTSLCQAQIMQPHKPKWQRWTVSTDMTDMQRASLHWKAPC